MVSGAKTQNKTDQTHVPFASRFAPENSVRSCVHFCMCPLVPLERWEISLSWHPYEHNVMYSKRRDFNDFFAP